VIQQTFAGQTATENVPISTEKHPLPVWSKTQKLDSTAIKGIGD
jgi:hypothetical protein